MMISVDESSPSDLNPEKNTNFGLAAVELLGAPARIQNKNSSACAAHKKGWVENKIPVKL
jgi:hypothetical protein